MTVTYPGYYQVQQYWCASAYLRTHPVGHGILCQVQVSNMGHRLKYYDSMIIGELVIAEGSTLYYRPSP